MLTLMPADASPVMKAAANPSIVRTPFYLHSCGQAIFVWLHRCDSTFDTKHGIVICPPLGYEQIHSHRALRHLADSLALAGFAVVRLDYHGTGDSSGIDEQPDRVARWLANVRDVMAWMLQKGCIGVSLFGLRLGATLAMQVAADVEVENLVLWAPIVKGRQYVREMNAISRTAEKKPQSLPNSPDDIEAAGFVITKQTAQDLAALDLLKIRPHCKDALIVARDDLPENMDLLNHLRTHGISATQVLLPGYAEMMAEPHLTKVPAQAIANISIWHSNHVVTSNLAPARRMEVHTGDTSTSMPHVVFDADGLTAGTPIVESVLRLSDRPDLIGILSRPETGILADRPLVVLINGGAAYRVGPSRFHVLLSRELAAQGFGCLRLDLNGLGDSVAANDERENEPYAATAFRDIELTLEYLHGQMNVKWVVLIGLCSGAYMAFQSASQFCSGLLVESVLINPLTYYWRDGMTMEDAPAKDHQSYHYYMKAALQPRKWVKLLSGGTKIGILGAVRLWLKRFSPPKMSAPIAIADATGAPNHPLAEDTAADLDRIANSGRRLTCVFSRSDPGYSLLLFQARAKVEELERAGVLKTIFIENADHTFSERVPRLEALRAICDHLRERY